MRTLLTFATASLACLATACSSPAASSSSSGEAHASQPRTSQTQSNAQPVTGDQELSQEIEQMMNQAAADWTQGNLEGFMNSYYKSEDLRFAHPKGITMGWQTVMDGYQDGIAASDLEFSHLDVTVLADDAAMVFGRFHNRGEANGYQTGLFTLLVRKIDGQWKIVHDHSSNLPDGFTDPREES